MLAKQQSLPHLAWLLAFAALACGEGPVEPPIAPEDTSVPFPIDGTGGPATYKGLRLQLVDTGEPVVTAVDGVIGVVCVGMSNGNQECNAWIQQVAGAWSGEVNPAVRIVNCAVGGHAIEKWIDPAFDAALWGDCVTRRLPQAGVRLDQVRVRDHRAASRFGLGRGAVRLLVAPPTDSDYFDFLGYLDAFAARVRGKFPAVQAVYTSSRSYGGFSGRSDRGEPLSYEEGHALNSWLADHREVDGVRHAWGAYLWAPACGGGTPGNGGGICYQRGDYVDDGVHPSDAGRLKIARLTHDRLREHGWYRR